MYTKDGMFTSDGTWEYKPLLANQIPTVRRTIIAGIWVAFFKECQR